MLGRKHTSGSPRRQAAKKAARQAERTELAEAIRKLVAEVRLGGGILAFNRAGSTWLESTKELEVGDVRKDRYLLRGCSFPTGYRCGALAEVLFSMAHEWGHHLAWLPGGWLHEYNSCSASERAPLTPRQDTVRDECSAWIAGEAYIPRRLRPLYWERARYCLATYGISRKQFEAERVKNTR